MTKTELKLDYKIVPSTEKVPVIIVAAGSSTRMGENKQLMDLEGMPVIIRSLLAFEKCDCISDIILVVKADDLFTIQNLCTKYSISKLKDIVCGGATRQDSVLNGFARLPSTAKNVLIHDGARPLVADRIICDVVVALENHKASLPVVKVKDTVKQIDSDGKVVRTVPRDNLVLVQTPQGVSVKEYVDAVSNVDVTLYTDDASIMEAAGYDVITVDGSYKNIKITTREDIAMARVFLSEGEE